MKKKKSVLLSISLIVILLLVVCISVFAAGTPTVYADYYDDVLAGETVSIPIAIKNNTGLMGFRINIDYDSSVLTPTSISYGDVVQGGLQDNIDGDAKEGSFCVYWAGSGNVTGNGRLFYANFEVSEYAVSSTELQLSYSQADTFDEDFNDVKLNCESKMLNISNSSITTYVKLNANANDIVAGENVVLRISPEDVKNLSSAELNIKYDADNLSYVSTTNSTVTDYNGVLSLNIPNASKVVELTFKSSDTATEGKYNFEITSSQDNVICNNCEFTISASATSNIAQIKVAKTYFELGEKIKVPVVIENNKGIMGYRLTFEYDTELLANPVVENSNKFIGNLNDSIGRQEGTFDVLWNSSEQISKDDVLFYITFDALKAGTTEINVSYDQNDTFNEKYDDVQFNCTNAELIICSGHYYHYIGNVKSYEMDYVCDNCGILVSFDADEVYANWSNKVVNTIPNNQTSILDVNNDNFINAKDYAMIRNSQKLK